MNRLINLLIRYQMALNGLFVWRPFARKTRDPAAAQKRVLKAILRRNRNTRFGREHGFASIATPEEYTARVPLQNYEDLRPYIEREQQGHPRQLTLEPPIMFAQTSGTTGKPKYIPVLLRTVAQAKTDQRLFSYCHAAAVPGIFCGKTLAFVSPAVEGLLPSGVPFGSMSGMLYRSMPALLRRKYAVPSAVFECRDHELKYYLIAAFAVAERSISYIAAANPSTFLKLVEVIQSRAPSLLAAIETGELPGLERLDAPSARAIQGAFRKNPPRARELARVFAAPPQRLFSALWPELKAVSCWCEGSCRMLLPAVKKLLRPDLPLLELGYLSSEARGSAPVDSLNRREVPSLDENYFEFIERTDWEAGRCRVRTVEQLQVGEAYYVIITTQAGLYRYFMNDIIRVDGRYEQTPTIKFVEKGAGVTNITGEKLYESQVTDAIEAALAEREASALFFAMVADEEKQEYVLYLEAPDIDPAGLIDKLETEIFARNIEYKAKRASGRLRPARLRIVRPGTGEAYKAHFLAQGQREAQFKFVRLQSRARLSFDLDAYTVEAAS